MFKNTRSQYKLKLDGTLSMYKYIIIWLFVLVLLLLIYYFYFQNIQDVKQTTDVWEYFENKNTKSYNYSKIDNGYTTLFDIVSNNRELYNHDIKELSKTLTSTSYVLIAGTGTGHHQKKIEEIARTIGIEEDLGFFEKAQINCQRSDVKRKMLVDEDAFMPETFTHICSFGNLFNNHTPEDQNKILNNFHKWLKPKGQIFMHHVDPENIDPGPRPFSQLYYDENGTEHMLTYFDKFSHDAWFTIPKNIDTDISTVVNYNELYTLFNDKKMLKITVQYYTPEETILKWIKDNGLKLEKKKNYKDISYDDTNLLILRK